MITPRNLAHHELIGLECRIASSSNKRIIGLEGRVVDETRNILTIEVNGKEKNFLKDQSAFSFKIPSGERVRIEGRLLVGRPEDRIKKRLGKW
jgi:ribonuclease P protein subunit POP4